MADGEQAAVAGEVIGVDEVRKRIPHRYPMLLVDRAENYVPFKSITGIKGVTHNEPYFQGHFPKYPIMPGVLQIEAMAQAGAILMSKSLEVEVEKHTIFFTSVDGAKFRSPVRPGDLLRLEVEVLKYRGRMFKFRGVARVDDRRTCEAEFAAMVQALEE